MEKITTGFVAEREGECLSVFVCVCEREKECVCVCERERERRTKPRWILFFCDWFEKNTVM